MKRFAAGRDRSRAAAACSGGFGCCGDAEAVRQLFPGQLALEDESHRGVLGGFPCCSELVEYQDTGSLCRQCFDLGHEVHALALPVHLRPGCRRGLLACGCSGTASRWPPACAPQTWMMLLVFAVEGAPIRRYGTPQRQSLRDQLRGGEEADVHEELEVHSGFSPTEWQVQEQGARQQRAVQQSMHSPFCVRFDQSSM